MGQGRSLQEQLLQAGSKDQQLIVHSSCERREAEPQLPDPPLLQREGCCLPRVPDPQSLHGEHSTQRSIVCLTAGSLLTASAVLVEAAEGHLNVCIRHRLQREAGCGAPAGSTSLKPEGPTATDLKASTRCMWNASCVLGSPRLSVPVWRTRLQHSDLAHCWLTACLPWGSLLQESPGWILAISHLSRSRGHCTSLQDPGSLAWSRLFYQDAVCHLVGRNQGHMSCFFLKP